jgi:nifR3 family TIM-barrel protein
MQFDPKKAQPDATRSPIAPIQLGPEPLERNLILAPMAGVTNLPFRLIAAQSGAALVFTETVSAKGLVHGGAKSWRLVESAPREDPLAYQLFGGEVEPLGAATAMLADRGARFIDLNLGCPVKKFLKHGAGSCLMRDPPKIAPLVAAMRRALPHGALSVKMRLGWDQQTLTAPEVARIAEAEGADFVSVHGRTRAQQYRGRANLDGIAEVVASVRIPVFANGDITTPTEALHALERTRAAGVMIGRGAMNQPWIFSQIVELAGGSRVHAPDGAARAALVEKHIDLMLRFFPDPRSTVHMLKKYLCAYASGIVGASEFRNRINRADDLDSVVEDAMDFFRAAT